MPEPGSWLHVRAAGMDLLLSTLDLREVVPASAVAPLPRSPRGIQGVVIYQGEFLPVLAWGDLPGCPALPGSSAALVVLRPRLGLPIEHLVGTVDLPGGATWELDEADPAAAWSGGICRLGERALHVVDPDRLVSLLRRFKGEPRT